jgi:thioredoxin
MSSSFTRPGAVDLSALAAKAKKAAEAASGPPGRRAGGGGATAGSSAVIDVTEADFQAKVIDQSMTVPVVVDFWADWCGPCRMMAPMLEEIAAANAEKVTVAKLNVDENPAALEAWNVMSVPTLCVFVNGQQVKQIVGAKSKSALLRELAEYL